MKKLQRIIWAVIILFSPSVVTAAVQMEGYFIAEEACPAYLSIKKKTNPDAVALHPGYAYKITAKNKPNAAYYRVVVNEASPKSRWVETSCGKALIDCKTVASASVHPAAEGKAYVLAVNWQPAFCQTHRNKTECRTQTAERYDADHFTLHGLWPQPRSNIYCNVSSIDKSLDQRGAWDQLGALGLSETAYTALLEVMPGAASYLQRHEWIKHGTCYGQPAEIYFGHAVALLEQINDSAVRELFADNIGKTVKAETIRAAFDEAFGPGSGEHVSIVCSAGMITELQINLDGIITDRVPVNNLLQNAQSTDAGCTEGIVDAVGF